MSADPSRTPPSRQWPWVARLPSSLAISLGLTEAEPEYAGHIRAAQIDSIARLTPVAMLASCANGIILMTTLNSAGKLSPLVVIWFVLLCLLALRYLRIWFGRRRRDPARPASHNAIRRAILHGVVFGAVWGAVPIMVFPGASPEIQLFIGCLTAGTMCSGAFVLGTVPVAGLSYVGTVAAGGAIALMHAGSPVDFGLLCLLGIYVAVIITNLSWNGQLFIDHFLSAARLQAEINVRERTHAQISHAQRMAALGQLAGGIAHDFNNILQAVASSAVSIANRTQESGQVRGLSARILEAAERGGAISRRLLAFAHQDTLSGEPIDPADLLTDAHELLRPAFDSAIGIRLEAPPGLPHLLADRAQLDTVLVNLTTNARDAMPYGGTLTLRVAADDVPQDMDEPPLKAGRYVRISVADTGSGMDAATLARATEPFFTTKPKGRGTGLGLSMAKGFAEQSGGALAIASTPGRGTHVSLWLPRTDAAVIASAPRSAPAFMSRGTWRPHVLLVDDDELVRETLIESLSGYGFLISCVEGAPAALDHLDRGKTVDVLVTDFSMPGMNGLDLIRAAQTRRPGLAAILLTGHVGDIGASAPDGADRGRYILLRKPVRAADLAQQFAAALEAAA